jgi:U3 small nucleolar RNA-associated protein MPP10
MAELTLDNLLNDPSIIFSQPSANEKEGSGDDVFDYTNLLISLKDIVDPVIKETNDCVLDEIFVDGLDATQVWGQVKLVFDAAEKDIWEDLEILKSEGKYSEQGFDSDEDDDEEDSEEEAFGEMGDVAEEDIEEEVEQEEEDDDDEAEEDEEAEAEEENDDQEEEVEEEETDSEEVESKSAKAPTNDSELEALNDGFFDLDDYKRQVLALEDNNFSDDDDNEEVDLLADMSGEEDEDEEMYSYKDFFDDKKDTRATPNGKSGKNKKNKSKSNEADETGEFGEDEYDAAYENAQADFFGEDANANANEEDEQEEHLSNFEKQQRELQKQISELEAESIAEKKWTMKGEVSGKQRQTDTLLQEELEFDRTAKPVPVITQETTETLEEIIKRRIVNQEFDEIPKRIISELNNFKPSKKINVSEEKSTKSLAELYEDEYAGKTGDDKVTEELEAAHNEISELFKDVTYQLDSLYSSHFVPKPKEKLLDVRIDTSTIAMEDAQPLTMASSNTMAPQEIYKMGTKIGKNEVVLKSGVVMAKAELERDDKQRLHRAKKRKQHLQSKDESQKKKKVESKQL